MSNFWKRLFQLEKAVSESSPSQPAVHELIQRDQAFVQEYEQWKTSYILRRLLDDIRDAYLGYQATPRRKVPHIDFLDIPSSKGFIFHFHATNYSQQEATFLFDYFKERIKAINYRTQISDTRTYARNNWVETVERHYLKPRLEIIEGQLMDQQYGNITIELEIRDDAVHHLRLRATHYQDRNFVPVRDFGTLMQFLMHAT